MGDINKVLSKKMKEHGFTLAQILKDEKTRIELAIMASELKTKREVGELCGFSKRHMFRIVKKYGLQDKFPQEEGS